MWGTVEGRTRIEPPSDMVRPSRYRGTDWWRDCGDEEALLRHEALGQLPCMICVEGARRRRAEEVEERTGVPLTEEALIRQLSALRRRSDAQRRRYAPKSPCGTEPARRRHRRWQETCSTCGIRDGRSGATS
jgi:hypothetical protein